ncbi:MAG: YezD family protein [Isosphaeraceae bacterium]|nr:YezD family protein [Isosphaeraceae bacterium]
MSSHERLTRRDDERPRRPPWGNDVELHYVREAIQGIRHGEVRVVIQDGIVIQIDRMEKQRLR